MSKKYQVRKIYLRANEYKVKVGEQPPFDGIFSETRFNLTIVDEKGSDDFPLFNLYKESQSLIQHKDKQVSFIDEPSKKRFYEIRQELQKDSDFIEVLNEYHREQALLIKKEEKRKQQSGKDGLGLLEQEERLLTKFICKKVINFKEADSKYQHYLKEIHALHNDYITLLLYIQGHYPQQTHPLAVHAATGLYHIQMAREAIERNDPMKAAYYTGLAVQRRYMSGIHADFEKSHFQAIARNSVLPQGPKSKSTGNAKYTKEERQKIINEVKKLHSKNPSLSKSEACNQVAKKIDIGNSYINEGTGKKLKRNVSGETFRKWKEIEAIF